jgi:formylglycine-generating enzyme required for sulfatase activity
MIRDVLRASDEASFTELVQGTNLKKDEDFRSGQWSGVPLRGCDIRGYDFSGSRMINCDMTDALIAGAHFDKVEIDRIVPNAPLDPQRTQLCRAKDWGEHVRTWVRAPHNLSDRHLRTGAVFQDAPFAAEMVVVPSGTYLQGDETKPVDGLNRREVTIAHRLAVGRYPVTFEEWDYFVDKTGRQQLGNAKWGLGNRRADDEGWGRGRRPVINVTWLEITENYLPWINEKLGLSGANAYRLLTESEWEYCCRAGTETAYSFGDTIAKDQAQYSDREIGSATHTVEIGRFPSNAWGLHDMHGNVWEWCQDVSHKDYRDAPDDGSACVYMADRHNGSRVFRGGSWYDISQFLRSAFRGNDHLVNRGKHLGFRLARTLNP